MSAAIDRINPSALPDAGKIGYSQISIAPPGPLAFVSGQVAWRPDGAATPASLADQTAIVVDNLQGALDTILATTDDIVQMRIYMTELTDETQGIAMSEILKFLDGAQPSLTGIGVAALAAPDLQIEVEMVVKVSG
ncbi:RidA family protein [uncultured Ruegeria sp.]|jgi:enamine deaminase RidA (YjgF/YER057c/UK114 family)|uniref:RidA family protein n=1 Tax=uncultured Ruegeria sp. TaxID=259304 RepID=UPI002624DD51|nr:RidA family protein [uncultured Ruegeria sp.]